MHLGLVKPLQVVFIIWKRRGWIEIKDLGACSKRQVGLYATRQHRIPSSVGRHVILPIANEAHLTCVIRLLQRLGLRNTEKTKAGSLSGGEQQRLHWVVRYTLNRLFCSSMSLYLHWMELTKTSA